MSHRLIIKLSKYFKFCANFQICTVLFCCRFFFFLCIMYISDVYISWHSVDSKRKNFIVQGTLFPYCANDIKHFELN